MSSDAVECSPFHNSITLSFLGLCQFPHTFATGDVNNTSQYMTFSVMTTSSTRTHITVASPSSNTIKFVKLGVHIDSSKFVGNLCQ